VTLKGWLIALAIARGLDAASTCQALDRGAGEINGLIHNCPSAIAVTTTMTAIQAATLPVLANEGHPTAAKWIAKVSTFIEVGVAAHNYHVAVVMGNRGH